ncbi:MAG: MarR family transcriptional regulator [Polyangiales bacterium]
MPRLAKPIDFAQLELTHLAFIVGSLANSQVLDELKRAGFGSVRQSHGYVIQHLLEGPRAVGELAGLLGVSQQAVSKSVAELEASGVIESIASSDARVRRVQLSTLGERVVSLSRSVRRKLERRLQRRTNAGDLEAARRVLLTALEELGGTEAVKQRRVRPTA